MEFGKRARARGITYALPTIAGHSIEEVRAGCSGPLWYQLYTIGGRATVEPALERARKAGYEVLLVTIDTAVAGMRERDLRNGNKELLGNNVLAKLPYLPSILARPRWLWSFWRDGGVPSLPNIVVKGESFALMDVSVALADAVMTWDDLRWVRAAAIFDALAQHGVTHLCGAPIVMSTLVNASEAERKSFPQKVRFMAAAAPTSSRRSAWERGRCSSGALMLTAWPRTARPES